MSDEIRKDAENTAGMADDSQQPSAAADAEMKESMKEHVEELHKEDDGAKSSSSKYSILIFAFALLALGGVWYIASEYQQRRVAAQDIISNMNKIKASSLMVFSDPNNLKGFPVGSKVVFTEDATQQVNNGAPACEYEKYSVVNTPRGIFVEYQGDPMEIGTLRELAEQAAAQGLLGGPEENDGPYSFSRPAPVFMLIKAVPVQ